MLTENKFLDPFLPLPYYYVFLFSLRIKRVCFRFHYFHNLVLLTPKSIIKDISILLFPFCSWVELHPYRCDYLSAARY